MTPRSMGGIVLIPKNNRGRFYFYVTKTGIRIHARKWTVLHDTESVIDRVEKLASDKGINEMVDEEMLFEWNPGDPVLFQHYEKEVIPP